MNSANVQYANFECPDKKSRAFATGCTVDGDVVTVPRCPWCGDKHEFQKDLCELYDTAAQALKQSKAA